MVLENLLARDSLFVVLLIWLQQGERSIRPNTEARDSARERFRRSTRHGVDDETAPGRRRSG